MRSMVVGFAIFGACFSLRAEAAEWELVPVVGETDLQSVAVSPMQPSRLFAASRRALFESPDNGQSWMQRFRAPAHTSIVRVAVGSSELPALLVATDQGLYGSFDGGALWMRVVRDTGPAIAECTHIAFHPTRSDLAALGTRDGLFLSADAGRQWREVTVPQAARDVLDFTWDTADPDQLYLVARGGVFAGKLATGVWEQRLTGVHGEDTELPPGDAVATAEESEVEVTPPRYRAIAVHPQQPVTLYLGGMRGLERSDDGGRTWQSLSRSGTASLAITRLLLQAHSPPVVYAATDRGVSRYDPTRGQWRTLAGGLAASAVNDLTVMHDHLWAATAQGLYRLDLPTEGFGDAGPTPQELLLNFVHEPTIAQVREAAIRYAEVRPEKIRRWRRQAALQALLPNVNLGFDHDRSRDIHVDEGSFPSFQLIHTSDQDASLNASVTWDLGELIWNDDQTTIDVRSKLMVQLRDDIVDEVTRTYFERRRLQVALLVRPPDDPNTVLEKELRVQELTALIDGLTGGYFSDHAQMPVNP